MLDFVVFAARDSTRFQSFVAFCLKKFWGVFQFSFGLELRNFFKRKKFKRKGGEKNARHSRERKRAF